MRRPVRNSRLTDELINNIEDILSDDSNLEVNYIYEILSNKLYKTPSSTLSVFQLKINYENKSPTNDLMNLAPTHMENHLFWSRNYKFYNCDFVIFADEVIFLDVRKVIESGLRKEQYRVSKTWKLKVNSWAAISKTGKTKIELFTWKNLKSIQTPKR